MLKSFQTGSKLVTHMRDDPDNSHIRDSTLNNNDGTKKAAGEPAVTISGKIDDAQDFDGVDDYVEVPDSPHWILGGGTGNFAIELWANLATLTQGGWWTAAFIAQDEGGGSTNKWIFSWDKDTDKLVFHINTPAGGVPS